jgi:hypothetical protein
MYTIRVTVTFATLELPVCEWVGFSMDLYSSRETPRRIKNLPRPHFTRRTKKKKRFLPWHSWSLHSNIGWPVVLTGSLSSPSVLYTFKWRWRLSARQYIQFNQEKAIAIRAIELLVSIGYSCKNESGNTDIATIGSKGSDRRMAPTFRLEKHLENISVQPGTLNWKSEA